ncbi:cytidine deaminase [Segnochrobactraceae bacterium EtOH-i3]
MSPPSDPDLDDPAIAALFAAAREVRAKAHAPYSRFQVGAALVTRTGTIFAGCNCEVASYPEGWCAETTMLGSFVASGGGEVAAVLVMGAGPRLTTPCGGCRQRLAEFCAPDTPVLIADPAGVRARFTVAGLLPAGFILQEDA